jgi:hypothetical protein
VFNCLDCNRLFLIIYRVDNPRPSLKIQLPIAMKHAPQRFAVYLWIFSQFSDFGSKKFLNLFVVLSEPFFRWFFYFDGESVHFSTELYNKWLSNISICCPDGQWTIKNRSKYPANEFSYIPPLRSSPPHTSLFLQSTDGIPNCYHNEKRISHFY